MNFQTVEFLKDINLSGKIEVKIYGTPEDLTRDLRVDPEQPKRALGFLKGNELYANAGNVQAGAEIAPLLRHETLAHYGLDSIDSADKLKILKRIVTSRDIPFIKQYWDEVSETYGKKYINRPLKMAEEGQDSI